MIKAAGYFRFGNYSQLEIEQKTAIISNFASRQGYKLIKIENEQKGGILPASERLIELLEDKTVNVIIIPCLSCLTRNVTTKFQILQIAKKNDKKIISADGGTEELLINFPVALLKK